MQTRNILCNMQIGYLNCCLYDFDVHEDLLIQQLKDLLKFLVEFSYLKHQLSTILS